MTSAVRTDAPRAVRSGTTTLAAVAVASMAGFRLGVLPGGLVGVDVVLALIGARLASPAANGRARAPGLIRVWRLVWVPTFAAVALAVVWALVEPSVRLDASVRGAGLAAFGGYANWHQLLVGPPETLATRVDSPLQHLWAVAVLVQGLLVWWAVGALARRRRTRRPDGADLDGPLLLALGTMSVVVGLLLLAAGASGQTLLLATVPRASALLLAAAFGASRRSSVGDLVHSVAAGSRWLALAVLAACALFASPMSTFGRVAGVTLVPLFAVIAVAAVAGPDPDPDPDGDPARSVPGSPALVSLLTASWFVLTPVLAIATAALPDAPTALVDIVGLVAAGCLTVPLAFACDRLSEAPDAVERRRVLAPPAAVALLVVLGSVTGAFHWEGPQPKSQWPRPSVRVVGERPAAGRPTP